jgi:hypothetical protein
MAEAQGRLGGATAFPEYDITLHLAAGPDAGGSMGERALHIRHVDDEGGIVIGVPPNTQFVSPQRYGPEDATGPDDPQIGRVTYDALSRVMNYRLVDLSHPVGEVGGQ